MTFDFVVRRRIATCASTALLFLTAASCSEEGSSSPAGDATGTTGGDFHSLVADPSVPGRLYVGGHSSVSRSDDGGRTWQSIPALDSADAMGWALADDAIWVSGHPGVVVSFDGGATFAQRNDGLPDTDVHAFGGGDGTLYAAGPSIGFASSIDDGVSWSTRTTDHGQAFFGRILVDPTDAKHLIASDVQVGVVESTDGGATWMALGSDPSAWVSSTDSLATIYASGGTTAQRSSDGGAWEPIILPTGATLVEVDAQGTLYTGVHVGDAVTVWVSTDDGQTWAPA